jgi:hypothetical protein
MGSVQPIQWLHGGKGICQFCGAESNHRALLMLSDRPGRLFLCRDCARKVRDDVDGFFNRAMNSSWVNAAMSEAGQELITVPPSTWPTLNMVHALRHSH